MSTWTPISGSVPQYQAADGTLASGYYLKFYSAGTTSPLSMATDSTGVTTLAKAQINTAGYPINGSSDVFIPHVSQSYKIVLYKNATDADNDTTGNADWVIDNISQSAAATPTQVINIEYQLGSQASGQVFTLANFTYALGVNNLLVYRNGNLLRQGVSHDYEETSASSVTINSSITIASTDQFAFVKGTSTTSTISDAASVTYTPAGVGAVTTNVKAELDAIGSIISESSGIVTVDATSEIRLKTASTDRVTVDSSGNVGIGESSPDEKLHLGGSANQTIRINSTKNPVFYGANTDKAELSVNYDVVSGAIPNSDRSVAHIQLDGQNGGSNIILRTANANNTVAAERMRIDSAGNLLLGGTSVAASSVGNLHLFNGTAPTGSATNGVILYSEDVTASAELKVRDEAGNVTTLSPHNFSLIPDGPSEEMAWAYYSEKDGKRINVDMLKLARMVEKLTGEKLVYED
jgi:hypothetical protein